jgi:hypothetical protein
MAPVLSRAFAVALVSKAHIMAVLTKLAVAIYSKNIALWPGEIAKK